MKSTFKTLPLLPMLAIACGLMASCQTRTTATTPDKGICAVLPPITYSGKSDTAETVQQVRQFNAARDSYCK